MPFKYRSDQSTDLLPADVDGNFLYASTRLDATDAAILLRYTKPGPGIPITDMTTGVQTSLGKADSALQLAAADARYVRTVNGQAPDGAGNVVPGASAAALSAVTYDGSNRVTGYTLGGVAYVVAYPSSTSITITGGGKVTTITLDGSGRVVGKAVA